MTFLLAGLLLLCYADLGYEIFRLFRAAPWPSHGRPRLVRIVRLFAPLAAAVLLSVLLLLLTPSPHAGAGSLGYLLFVACVPLCLGLLARWFRDRDGDERTAFRQGLLRFAALAFAIVGLLEVFVFNAKSFTRLGEGRSLSLSAGRAEGLTDTGLSLVGDAGAAQLTFDAVGVPVGTLYLDAVLSDGIATLPVDVDFSDESSAAFRTGEAALTLVRGMGDSRYMVCHFSGEVGKLRLRFTVPPGERVELRGVAVNRPIPLRFHAGRVLLLYGAALLIFLLLRAPFFRRPCRRRQPGQSAVLAGTTALFLLAALVITLCYRDGRTAGLAADFKQTQGNQITQELVDAFERGQVHLLTEPSPDLLAMENPYDWLAREEQGFDYLWDHVLYDGQYYSYYGIAPVVLLFLPYHLLTGYYFPTVWAVFLFGAGGILFLSLAYMAFVRNWFRRLPFGAALMGLITVQAASGIWLCFASPLFYEIAQAAGFFFVTGGVFFLLRAGIAGPGRLSPVRVALGTAMLALAVMSRPTLAVYALVSLPVLWFGWRRARGKRFPVSADAARRRRRLKAGYLLAALGPYVLLGGVQMLYNLARFGNPLEFGIQYSLTINDFTRSQFHGRMAAIGFYNFLFAVPQVKPEFPFIFSQFSTLGLNGYYFIASTVAMGLFFRALPAGGLCLAGRARRLLPSKTRRRATGIWVLFCLAAPAVILFSIWESGYAVRYCTDFSWQVLFGAYAVLYTLYLHSRHAAMKALGYKLMLAAAVLALLVNAAFLVAFLYPDGLTTNLQASFAAFARLFEFWK